MTLSAAEVIERIEATYPQLSSVLHDEIVEGLTHLQIAEFSRLTQQQIDEHDCDGFQRTCRLFIELWDNAVPAVINALNVSFLEHLVFEDETIIRRWAYDEMPERMRVAYEKMQLHNRRIHGQENA